MEISRNNITSVLLLGLAFIGSLTLYFYWNDGINQLFLIISFVILMGLALLTGVFSERIFIVILCLNVASLMVTMAFHKGLGVTLLFMNVLLASFIFNNIRVERWAYIMLHLIPALLWLVFCIAAIKGSFYYGETYQGETYWGYQCFGMIINENTIGLLSLCSIFHWACLIEQLPARRMTRILATIAISAFPAWRMIQAGCRSVFMAMIIFGVLCFVLRGPIPYRTYYFLVLGVILFSLLFAFVYVIFIERLELGEIMGRDSTSRVYIWEAAFELIKQYPIFGSGTEIRMVLLDSAHNTILSWFKTIGLLPTITYSFFLVKRRPGNDIPYSKVAQAAVLAGLIIGFFESYYADSFFYMSFMLFLLNPESKSLEYKKHEKGQAQPCVKVAS